MMSQDTVDSGKTGETDHLKEECLMIHWFLIIHLMTIFFPTLPLMMRMKNKPVTKQWTILNILHKKNLTLINQIKKIITIMIYNINYIININMDKNKLSYNKIKYIKQWININEIIHNQYNQYLNVIIM